MRNLTTFAFVALILLLGACDLTRNAALDSDNLPNIYDRRIGKVALQDEAIEIKTRETLQNDAEIQQQSHINVNVYNGTLLITGETPENSIHEKIVAAVRVIPGITRVLDEIEIGPLSDPSSRYNDSIVTNRIKTELDKIRQPPGFNSQNIKIVTESGIVYLLGLVYKAEAEAVTKTTQEVSGVMQVIKYFEYLR